MNTKPIVIILVALSTSIITYAQTAKIEYTSAVSEFEQNNYKGAITFANSAKKTLGSTNPKIESLLMSAYFEDGDIVNAKIAYERLLKTTPVSKQQSPEFLVFIAIGKQINNELEIKEQVFKRLQEDILPRRMREAKLIEKRYNDDFKAKTSKITTSTNLKFVAVKKNIKLNKRRVKYGPEILSTLNAVSKLKEGKIYVFNPKKRITNCKGELSFFVFYGSKYLIFTIPNYAVIEDFAKENIHFTSKNARKNESFALHLFAKKVKTQSGKYPMSFSDIGGNFFLGGKGENLLQQNNQLVRFNKTIFYENIGGLLVARSTVHYYSDNSLIWNPYIESGSIIKSVDFNLVKGDSLISLLKKHKVKDLSDVNTTKSNTLSVKLLSSRTRKMISSEKHINYALTANCCIDVTYTQNGALKKVGGYLYYTPESVSSHYNAMQYSTGFSSGYLLKNIYETGDKNYTLTKTKFDALYSTINADYGSGQQRVFTNSNYKLPMEASLSIAKIRAWERASVKDKYKKSIQPIKKSVTNSDFGDFLTFMKNFDDLNIYSGKLIFWQNGWIDNREIIYNDLAWYIYEKSHNLEQLKLAILLIKKSIELNETFYNTDTYAALLYKTGKFTQALTLANRAIELAIKTNKDYGATKELIKKINAKL